ncbi:MAG: hypothetical protein ACO1QS_04990 [Verrucomicrobiota bacterium]
MEMLWQAYLLLLVFLQPVTPVLLIRRFKYMGILAAFGFTVLLHTIFLLGRVSLNQEIDFDIIQQVVIFAPLGMGLVYCLISIPIAGALENRAAKRKLTT